MGSEGHRAWVGTPGSREWPFPKPSWFPSCPFHCFFNQLAASTCRLYGSELRYKEKCWVKGCCHLRDDQAHSL